MVETTCPTAPATATATVVGDVTKSDTRIYDEQQRIMMETEMCILVDTNDVPLAPASKKDCHLMTNIDAGMLHRAFSVFLFNTAGQLLLQQRADEKITFPDHFTNTCCSHPLYFDAELDATNNIGVRRAAQRKLQQELGIPPEQLPLEDFTLLTRIHYKAPSDGLWGEHEIDYILLIQKDVTLNLNANEVKSAQYIGESQLRSILADAEQKKLQVTPWFRLICQDQYLYKWWNNLQHLEPLIDLTIQRL